MVYERLLWPLLFRATDESEFCLGKAVRRNGKWIYKEHIYMIRGMVPKERLLEWTVEDGKQNDKKGLLIFVLAGAVAFCSQSFQSCSRRRDVC